MAGVELSVVIPVRNEAPSLVELHREFTETLVTWGRSYEIIVVDDGSTDESFEILARLQAGDPHLRVIRFRRNFGQTAAFAAGFAHARGRLIATSDGDLQNDPHDIPAMLKQLDQWDAVSGWRVNRAAGDSWLRRLSSRIANRVRNRLSAETIQDSGCTFRAFRRECLRDLVLYKGFHRFVPTLLRMRGFRVLEVPVNHRPRRFGQSKYGIGNRAVRAFVDLLVVRWMKDRLLRYEIAEDLGGEPGGRG